MEITKKILTLVLLHMALSNVNGQSLFGTPLCSCSDDSNPYTGTILSGVQPCPEYEQVLVLEENFNADTLNTSIWMPDYGWGHNILREYSYYTKENLIFSNGTLKLKAEDTPPFYAKMADYLPEDEILDDGFPNLREWEHKSGAIKTYMNFSHGIFEMRCKLPDIPGVWPAFWLFGEHHQEIDIFEFYKESSGSNADARKEMKCTLHNIMPINTEKCKARLVVSKNEDFFVDKWRTFSVEWTPYKVVWRVDDTVIATMFRFITDTQINIDECSYVPWDVYLNMRAFPLDEDAKMSLIINLNVHNQADYPAKDFIGTFPKYLEIDYVKVWQRMDKTNDNNDVSITDNSPNLVDWHENNMIFSADNFTFAPSSVVNRPENSITIIECISAEISNFSVSKGSVLEILPK